MRFTASLCLVLSGLAAWAGSADRLVVARNTQGQILFLRKVPSGRLGTHVGSGLTEGRFHQWDPIILEAASHYAIDPYFIKAIGLVESRFNRNAKSRAGAEGPWQFMPGTADTIGINDPYDPVQAIWGCAALLRRLVDKYQGDMRKVAAAYNAGEKNVDKAGGVPNIPETQKYVPDVLWAWDDMQRN